MTDQLLLLAREALVLVLWLSAPPVLASVVTGFVLSVLQATTQIQEQTLTFAPKLVAAYAALFLAGPWIGEELVRFARVAFETIAVVG